MNNEPKVIYLNCYDEAETDESYLPIDNDFDSLDGENVLWSADSPCLGGNIKYIHHSEAQRLEAENNDLREALEMIKVLSRNIIMFCGDKIEEIAQQALKQK